MHLRMLLMVALGLAISILPANTALRIVSWVDFTNDYATYNWLIIDPPSSLNLFGVQTPDTAHISSFYLDCDWQFELSRYNSVKVKDLRPLGKYDMWAYGYKLGTSNMPNSLMMSFTTSASFAPGIAQYALITGNDITYGSTLGPIVGTITTSVPEPTSIFSLIAIVVYVVTIRRRR